MMSSSLKAPTKAERERWSYFPTIGCIACRRLGHFSLPQTHHQLSGSRRIGHAATVPLCPWHHVGEPPNGSTERHAAILFGPSLAKQSKRFRDVFGSDEAMLAETNRHIEALRSQRVGR